jgi:hypothetical protein
MNAFDLTKNLPDFEPMPIGELESADQAYNALGDAEAAYFRYLKMRPLLENLSAIVSDLDLNDDLYDLMTENDHCNHIDLSTMDTIAFLKDHVEIQIKKFKQYYDDLEDAAIDLSAAQREIAKFGSYDDQVRARYFSTR